MVSKSIFAVRRSVAQTTVITHTEHDSKDNYWDGLQERIPEVA